MKKRKTPDLEKYLEGKKRRFVNYTQGAKLYRMLRLLPVTKTGSPWVDRS